MFALSRLRLLSSASSSSSSHFSSSTQALKTGRLSPSQAYDVCTTLLATSPAVNITNSSSSSSSNITINDNFTSAFSQLFVSTIAPEKAVRLFSVSAVAMTTDNHDENSSRNNNSTTKVNRLWWERQNSLIDHSELISSVLKRASLFRALLTTSDLMLCLRVAITSFVAEENIKRANTTNRNNSSSLPAGSSISLVTQFYGYIIDEIISRLDHQILVSSSSSSELCKDTIDLLNAVRIQAGGAESFVKLNNKRLLNLEASALTYFDDVMVLGDDENELRSLTSQDNNNDIYESWFEYLEDRVSFPCSEKDSSYTLAHALYSQLNNHRQGVMHARAEGHVTKSSNQLVNSLKQVEDYLSLPSSTAEEETSSSSLFSPINRLEFIQKIKSSSIASETEALVVARSLIALAVWASRGKKKLSGEERSVLMSSFLDRHGFVIAQIRKFGGITGVGGKLIDEEALPKAVAILLDEF